MRDELGTAHADLRLLQRARQFDKSLTELWDEAIECEVKYRSYNEARVHPAEEIVLLRKDGKIVTILDQLHNVTIMNEDVQSYFEGVIGNE